MMSGHSASAVLELATYELHYSCMTRKTGTWKKARYIHLFSARNRDTALDIAKAAWDCLKAKHSHRLLDFDSLYVQHCWNPALGNIPETAVPEVAAGKRTFVLRFVQTTTGISGRFRSERQKAFLVEKSETAYARAVTIWKPIRDDPSNMECVFIGLFEKLNWRPE